MRHFRFLALLPLAALLGGCNFVVLDPSGFVAIQQRDLVVISTILMLVIILPVMALTVLFAWRYRRSNTSATYDPEWHHSVRLELVIWAAPLMIIICLGAVTWMATHLLDPFRPLQRISATTPVPAQVQPLRVEVVALDWKWLFIYPELGIATVNELAAPVDRPLAFRISASSVMNSFYIPALAGQIYAMPGMETQMHAVINESGTFRGFSANYSGAGFSGMHFAFHGLAGGDFDTWVAKVRSAGGKLDRAAYLELERPSENVPVKHFGQVEPNLFKAIINMCVEPGKMCQADMMAIDAKGGQGLASVRNVMPVAYDKYARRGTVLGGQSGFVIGICATDDLKTPIPASPPAAPFSPAAYSSPAQPSDLLPALRKPSNT